MIQSPRVSQYVKKRIQSAQTQHHQNFAVTFAGEDLLLHVRLMAVCVQGTQVKDQLLASMFVKHQSPHTSSTC